MDIGLQSLDIGTFFSPDGREMPIIGTTPVQSTPANAGPCSQYAVGSFDYQRCLLQHDAITGGATADPTTGVQTSGVKLSDIFSPNIAGAGTVLARVALILLAILLIVVAALRLTSAR